MVDFENENSLWNIIGGLIVVALFTTTSYGVVLSWALVGVFETWLRD